MEGRGGRVFGFFVVAVDCIGREMSIMNLLD